MLNGQDIRQYDRRTYYELFSAVFQDFSILDCTVAENVAQKPELIDRSRVKECLELAGMWEKVESLPEGMDTHLGKDVYEDGTELSGGQIQRLVLAQGRLYKNADRYCFWMSRRLRWILWRKAIFIRNMSG